MYAFHKLPQTLSKFNEILFLQQFLQAKLIENF